LNHYCCHLSTAGAAAIMLLACMHRLPSPPSSLLCNRGRQWGRVAVAADTYHQLHACPPQSGCEEDLEFLQPGARQPCVEQCFLPAAAWSLGLDEEDRVGKGGGVNRVSCVRADGIAYRPAHSLARAVGATVSASRSHTRVWSRRSRSVVGRRILVEAYFHFVAVAAKRPRLGSDMTRC